MARSEERLGCGAVLTIAIMFVSKKMKLEFGNFLWQTIAYSFILTFMTVFTLVLAIVNGGLWLTFAGMLLFILSDIILSMQYFGGKIDSKPLIVVNHALYYAAQIVLLAVIMII